MTLASLCDEYLETLRNAPKTLREKKATLGERFARAALKQLGVTVPE